MFEGQIIKLYRYIFCLLGEFGEKGNLGKGKEKFFGERKMRRQDGGNVLGTIWCGTLGIILIWLLVITIIFSLLIWDAHNRLDDFQRRLGRSDESIKETGECCLEITGTVDEFRPCIDEYCAPSNFPRLLDAVICRGCWNANTNVPTLTSGVGTNGDLYTVCVAGSSNLEGITDWEEGDTLKFIENTPFGPRWIKNDGSPTAPPDIEITMLNNVGDSEKVLATPGTGSLFNFKGIKGGRGIEETADPARVILNFVSTHRTRFIQVTYVPGTGVDPVDTGANWVSARVHYYAVSSFCDVLSGERLVTCGGCYHGGPRGPANSPPPGQAPSRPKFTIVVESMDSVPQPSDLCRCVFAVLGMDPMGVDTTVTFYSEAICVS